MQENLNIPDSTITTNLSFRQLVLMNMQQLTNFPYIEKDFDAISDYELLSLVVKYLNDVIANQNEQNDSITRMYKSFLALQDYVNNTKDTLEDAFNELDDYVRNYFANLDVQDKINNKLDDMAESGQLTDIIAQYLGLAGMIAFDTVADMKLATNLVNGSKCQTLGYYSVNDGGNAIYKIRTITNDDVVDDATIIEVYDNNLIAELLFDNEINPKKFGCKCDGTTDDTARFHICINKAIEKKLPIHIIGTLTLSEAYQLSSLNTSLTIFGDACGNTFSPEYVDGNISRILLKENTRFISGVTYTTANSNYPKLSINLHDLNFFSETSGEKYIFENIYLTGSLIKNNTSHFIGLIKGTLAVTSVVDSNKFVGLTCFMDRGSVSARELFSDSIITNNYISGLNSGYCFKNPVCGNMRITNNFIDYFKTIYGNALMGGTILSEGNIYDGYCYIFEGSDNQQMGQFSSVNDKYFTLTKARCVELGYITNDIVKTSFNIKALNYNIEIINPKIRYDANNPCDESFIYGSLYSPTLNLKISLINPSYCHNDGNAIGNIRLNINNLINVRLASATIAQVFANSGIAYVPARIDTLSEAPDTQRNSAYILPPWYRYYNTTDGKLYEFQPSGNLVDITP